MSKILLVLVILSAAFVNLVWTDGCKKYAVTLKETKACASNNVVQVINAEVHLTKSCILVINGCANIKKFATATVEYSAKKRSYLPLPGKSGKVDICKEIKARSQKCPFAKQKICLKDEKVDISKYSNFLFLAKGEVDVRLNVKHDTGKTCYDLVLLIEKKGGMFWG